MASNAATALSPQGYTRNAGENPLDALKKLLVEVQKQEDEDVIVSRATLISALEGAQELIEMGTRLQTQRNLFRQSGVMPSLVAALSEYWSKVGSKVFRQPMSMVGLQALAGEAVANSVAHLPPSMAQPPVVQLEVAMIEMLHRLSALA